MSSLSGKNIVSANNLQNIYYYNLQKKSVNLKQYVNSHYLIDQWLLKTTSHISYKDIINTC